MTQKILVTHATRAGSTAEIANAVKAVESDRRNWEKSALGR